MAELAIRGLDVWYGQVHALQSVDMDVSDSEIVAVLGFNGAGKSTLLRAISRIVVAKGEVRLDGIAVRGQPDDVVRHGIGHVLQGRGVFSDLTVRDNLLLAKFGSGPVGFADRLAAVLDFFPMLKSKIRQKGGELSGGQQQILAIGRALITAPRVLLMDEPSLGLAPVVFDQLRTIIPDIRRTWKTSVLMSEQNVQLALDVADRVYVLERGKVVHTGSADISVLGEELLRRYLGGRLAAPSTPSA
jgi:branched-chain amino acid transport system ATP-binding protein